MEKTYFSHTRGQERTVPRQPSRSPLDHNKTESRIPQQFVCFFIFYAALLVYYSSAGCTQTVQRQLSYSQNSGRTVAGRGVVLVLEKIMTEVPAHLLDGKINAASYSSQ